MAMNLKLFFRLLVSFAIGISVGYYFKESAVNSLSCLSVYNSRSDGRATLPLGSHIQLIDFNQKITNTFNCTKTKLLFDSYQTTICLHDTGKDIYVSQTILAAKIWEEGLLTKILKILLKNPDFYFIDVGANIGAYTMYVSSIGRKTIAIECYQPNIERIVRAVQIENVSKHVILVGNAIYNESGKILQFEKDEINVGGQGLLINQPIDNLASISKEFRVLTTRFDDLYPLFVNHGIANAIMKIDVELSEIFLCQSGHKLFDLINIVFVQMEWASIKLKKDDAEYIINFFTKRDYLPVATADCKVLTSTISNYTTWGSPDDIYWIKSKYYNICQT